MAYNILIFGASYGSLLATKMALAGHNAKMICLPNEAELFNKEGAIVRLPVKGREGLVQVESRKLLLDEARAQRLAADVQDRRQDSKKPLARNAVQHSSRLSDADMRRDFATRFPRISDVSHVLGIARAHEAVLRPPGRPSSAGCASSRTRDRASTTREDTAP